MADRRRASAAALEIRNLNVYYGASHALAGRQPQRSSPACCRSSGATAWARPRCARRSWASSRSPAARSASTASRWSAVRRRSPSSASAMCRRAAGCGPRSPSTSICGSSQRADGRLDHRAHLLDIPAPRRAPEQQRRPALGRRAADAGDLARPAAQPALLVMDEPTEGLAPVIVTQVEDMLVASATGRHRRSGDRAEHRRRHHGVRKRRHHGQRPHQPDHRRRPLANDRELQQRLLGVGRHGHEAEPDPEPAKRQAAEAPAARRGPRKIYMSNPTCRPAGRSPCRWPASRQSARTISEPGRGPATSHKVDLRPLSATGESVVLVAGTLDTKGEELRFIRDLIQRAGMRCAWSTCRPPGGRRRRHPGAPGRGLSIRAARARVFVGDRGEAVAAMTAAFERWIGRQSGIAGIIAPAARAARRSWRRPCARCPSASRRSWSPPSPPATCAATSARPTS
jgi:hypothetical protein